MKIKFFCPHWGQEDLSIEAFIKNAVNAGYDGVEMVVSTRESEKQKLRTLLKENNLLFIAQVLEAGKGGGFYEQLNETVFYLENAATMKPLKIDSFTGRDYFSFEQNSEIIQQNLEWEKKSNIQVVHEVHRGRFTYSLSNVKPYLDRFKSLCLNADFSHWCCVAESYLQETELADRMDEAISRADHIHARIGHPQGPQVNDPRAPEWKMALACHVNWWDRIIQNHKEKGTEVFTITPEFGPAPYLQTLPYSKKEVASQWDINVWMMNLLKARYDD